MNLRLSKLTFAFHFPLPILGEHVDNREREFQPNCTLAILKGPADNLRARAVLRRLADMSTSLSVKNAGKLVNKLGGLLGNCVCEYEFPLS